jgi:hypothetical protein
MEPVTCMGDIRHQYKVLVRKSEAELARHKHILEDTVKIDLKYIGLEDTF